MYSAFPLKWLFWPFAWLVLLIFLLVEFSNSLLPLELRITIVPSAALGISYLVTINPIWRTLWKICPFLGSKFFPDLNGTWDVELQSNWPRQKELIDAATNNKNEIDYTHIEDSMLAPLKTEKFRAEINQNWFKIEIKLWNPEQNSTIKDSKTITVSPIRGDGFKPHRLCYFFEQDGFSTSLLDTDNFPGAAIIEYHPESNTLEGTFWTARKWQRAINTAGKIKFLKIDPNSSSQP
ncbi:hypothetical protein [Thalassospira lucentensis]|uniref:hypothetical protein n=1 Tax=Thalassospira lucentensis TaxID=168935 RepID=UPI002941FCD4|nr:hypothetical protein [Thalassospira lucentensis]WOI09829.1 hypothetical protein R1T41_14995 [Thalassospira lucentensis]